MYMCVLDSPDFGDMYTNALMKARINRDIDSATPVVSYTHLSFRG